MKNLPLLIGSLLLTLAVVVGISFLFTKQASAPTTQQVVDQKTLLGDARHTKGSDKAPVAIVEFSDFQCPACKAAEPLAAQYENDTTGKIRFIYRSFPLRTVHIHALEAAKAAEAADAQKQFWAYHDILFSQQDDWASQNDPYPKFEQYAKQLKLNIVKFKQDYQSKQLETLVNNDERDGLIIGVNATPTFFVNGIKVEVPDLAQAVSKAMSAQ